MPNVITAIFNKKAPDVDTAPIYQYNYGQILRIEGLDLPPAVEIHFSLDSKHGTSVTRIGNTRESQRLLFLIRSWKQNRKKTICFMHSSSW